MFDIGFWEMLVIGVMALLVLGPERLPGAIRSTMSAIRSIKDVANGFKQEMVSQLDAHELHANLKKAESLGMENLGKDLQDSVNELKAAAASVNRPYKKNKIQPSDASAKQHTNVTKNDAVSLPAAKSVSVQQSNMQEPNVQEPNVQEPKLTDDKLDTQSNSASRPSKQSNSANNE